MEKVKTIVFFFLFIWNKSFNWGLPYGFRSLLHYNHDRKLRAHRHSSEDHQAECEENGKGWGRVREKDRERERKSVWAWQGLLKSQSLSHGLTSSNKASPSNLSHIVPLSDDKAFKYISLWGPFLFNLPHHFWAYSQRTLYSTTEVLLFRVHCWSTHNRLEM